MTRADPWAEFLRRILLSASLAGVGGVAVATAEETSPAAEIAEAEPQPKPLSEEASQR